MSTPPRPAPPAQRSASGSPAGRSPDAERSALVLFSGGQDSTTCLFWALSPEGGAFDRVEAVAFDYGQKHAVEIGQARQIADAAGVPFAVQDLSGLLAGSSLTEHDRDSNDVHDLAPDLPASFVPGRNALFLTLAAARGFLRGTRDLVGGMCETDYSGYPDCRADFVESQAQTLTLALGQPVRIWTPLMHLTKAETWKLARDLGEVRGLDVLETVRELSHTDYNGDRTERHAWGYGRLDNPASVLRARGYAEAEANGWLGER
ncbi:7-cyano-7-deazaguanine synthase QueC [Rubrivirga sp. S365]|uniref:7-cyano-7-deazaguanine synthase n=1 Tax=Rubrivirga litoralis TaxID=3075598 RepID=A0ABU3BTK4_9BACT|nr:MULTISPECIES: 7-cyano-7-deazaguanine synthase QueC [unclassified Rubrivirga]MDT0632619.1 7-cyano-7-deazaguanine synthase QueC [Rubrivirga sp. F394]MDT7855441.1 7-cyano-7-deazaguanine synthase QueC [Rubrivirga sp. S365]